MSNNIIQINRGVPGDPSDTPLKSGGGSGTFDGMEARVERLETDVAEIKSDLKAMRSDLSYIKGRIDAMPTTLQLLMFVIAIFVAAGITRYFVS